MTSDRREFRAVVAGKELLFRVGEFAGRADGSVTVQYGGTLVLGTAMMADPRPGLDFMPLLVEYEEKFYAAGKIKGSRFIKREGRPTDTAIVAGRLVDRSIRPLFPKGMRDDVQVVTTVLSYDEEHEPDILALIAASAALAVSRIPWQGPIGAVRVGRRNGDMVLNPSPADRKASDLDLIVAASEQEVVMLEADAQEIPEADLLKAIDLGTEGARAIAACIRDIQKEVGAGKVLGHVFEVPKDLSVKVFAEGRRELEEILAAGGPKQDAQDRVDALEDRLVQQLGDTSERATAVRTLFQQMYRNIVREWILVEGRRLGGRRPEELRPLSVQVGVLPRTHGSALFQRGETQVLSITTLGAPDDTLILDTMTEDTKKHFFHFYNMPGYSVGEVKPNRGPARRDIGHGMLAERSLARLVPTREAFPYTVMVVSEVLSSNGSSSMGSACAASLALMDAGVPFARHVGGIAMGLVTDEHGRGRRPVVLTDIAGMEDEGGDMDFKVSGTKVGVTALQVDIKVHGLPRDIIEAALHGARTARLAIIDAMERVLPSTRPELSPYAPRIVTFRVKPERIRDIIGPRGATINKIVEQTGAEITVEDDGTVFVTAPSPASIEQAVSWIRNLTREVVPGEEFVGRVTRLMNFGAFVELFPGTDGLLHISEFGPGFVRRIEDVAAVGDTLHVVVREIDAQGRVNLARKRASREEGGEGPSAPPVLPERREPSAPRRHDPRRPAGDHRHGRPSRGRPRS